MTPENACQAQQEALDQALAELKRLKPSVSNPSADSESRSSPQVGGDLGSRFYETIGRREAAHRHYRTAVRDLAECLRQQHRRPTGTAG
jgi:hypothetical protein